MDKWATKLVAEALGIRTAAGTLVRSGSVEIATYPSAMPLVVKPVGVGSSHGVGRVETAQQLGEALRSALIDDRALVEELVCGREVDIAILEYPDGTHLVGPPLEIVMHEGLLFDTEHKYDGTAEFLLPADMTDAESAALGVGGRRPLLVALGCSGVARFDFFVTSDGLVLNEVNTMPGMTAQSQVPRMFAAVGLPYAELLDLLIDAALARRTRLGQCADPGVVPLRDQIAITG